MYNSWLEAYKSEHDGIVEESKMADSRQLMKSLINEYGISQLLIGHRLYIITRSK